MQTPASGLRVRPNGSLLRSLRPREKLLEHGPGALSASELLALVIDAGGRRPRATEALSRGLLRRRGLEQLSSLDCVAWQAEKGVGPATAARLAALFEIARRVHEGAAVRPTLDRPKQAWMAVRHLGRAKKEHLVGLYLDAQNGLLHRETISIGSLNTTRTHPREVLYPAIRHLAMGFILAHNHPSGCLDPSHEDIEFTRAMGRAAELMGIELYDHLIVARDGFTSLRERGLL